PAGVRLPAAAAAGDSGRLGRVRVPGEQWGHHQGSQRHGDDPAQRGRLLPSGLTVPSPSPALGGTMPLRIESSSSTVAEGQTLDLNCVIASPVQATVTWYKRGGSLPARHQVGDTEGSVPRVQTVGVDPWPCARPHGYVQADVAPCKPSAPGQARVAPCKPHQPLAGFNVPVSPPAGVRLPAAA
ncbi:PGBM protein, partial [Asarcornis scutulata]|nr:PGBM protein [Asarcornis scutulata]